ncbi:unnamed protein product [Heterobilharzia americana]|nr:unnamed protein product [Heterobilharzia americana]
MSEIQTEALNLFLHDQTNLNRYVIQNAISSTKKPKWNSNIPNSIANSHSSSSLSNQFMQTKLHHQYALNQIRSKHIRAEETFKQSTTEWLENHSLKAKQLTIHDFVAMGRIPESRMRKFSAISKITMDQIVDEFKQNPASHLEYDIKQLNEFECGLHESIYSYMNRIKWLMRDTRKIFGLVRGEHVGLLLDGSDANLGFNRDKQFKKHLIEFINEQLNVEKLKTLYVASYGTHINSLWPYPMSVNTRTIDELKFFIKEQLVPSGGSNLLNGIKHMIMYGRKQLDVIIIICGSCPDQPTPFILQYLEQILVGFNLPRLHLVAYDCQNPEVNQLLAQMATIKRDFIYHCYVSDNESAVYTSDEIARLLKEVHDAQIRPFFDMN